MHLEDEQIQRLLHGELTASDRSAVERHVTDCAQCRQRLALAEQDEAQLFALLRQADHPTPAVTAHSVMARARRSSWKRWAAAVGLIIVGAGAAYAAPGSPLPGWLSRVTTAIAPPDQIPAISDSAQGQAITAGISVTPTAKFTIRFSATQVRGTVAVSLADRPDIAARVLNGTATFTSATNGLLIDNTGSVANYEIELPRTARWVEIRVEQRQVLLKEGSRVLTADSAAGDQYLVSLVAPAR